MTSIPIEKRNQPWPAEILDHPQFIASLAKWYRPNLFVEYGSANGDCTRVYAPFCKKVYGVDMTRQPLFAIPNLIFHKMSTREFKTSVLDKLTEPIDMAFIDADHKAEVAFQDFEDLFTHTIENGIIFLHDTFPCEAKWADPIFSGDSWKVPYMIKEKYGNVCDVFTIPIQPGLTMVRKYTKPLSHMVYTKSDTTKQIIKSDYESDSNRDTITKAYGLYVGPFEPQKYGT